MNFFFNSISNIFDENNFSASLVGVPGNLDDNYLKNMINVCECKSVYSINQSTKIVFMRKTTWKISLLVYTKQTRLCHAHFAFHSIDFTKITVMQQNSKVSQL